jgi:flagellar hook-associated protein 1 FlgK
MGSLYGIFNATRSLSLNQAVIDIINNNISNINTPGYSKQRAELSQLTSGNVSSIPQNAAQDSMGAIITQISRNRDLYLDNYFRSENSDFGYYKELKENSGIIEDLTNELNGTGLNSALNEFYKALSQLSSSPEDFVSRSSTVQKAIELATKFNSMYNQLENFRTNLVGDYANPSTLDKSKLKLTSEELNSKLSSIANLNNSIILSTVQGTSPNYLLDQRDKLLDDISELIPIDITNESNGSVTLKLGNADLVRGSRQFGFFNVTAGNINNPSILQVQNDAGGAVVADAYSLVNSGKLGAILEIGGSDTLKLTIKSAMDNLTTLAQEISTALNNIQMNGQFINNSVTPQVLTNTGIGLFFVDNLGSNTNITAGNIRVRQAIMDNPYLIAAASGTATASETGEGSNALLMSQIRSTLIATLGGSTTEQYITNLAGNIGSKASSIRDSYDLKDNISKQVSLKRESVIGVNLDEELTDLVRFQRAYEASARIFGVVDKNLQTIINMAR